VEQPSITGTIVRTHLELLDERFGAGSAAECIRALPAECRQALEGVTAAGWLPITTWEAFYDAFSRQVGADVAVLHGEMSRQSVERTFKTLWRVLLRFTTDDALVSRTPLLYSRAYTHGKLTSRFSARGVADVELGGWPGVPEIVLRGTRGAVETVLQLAGRKSARVTWQRARDGATFRATWSE
jgi:hypothetical protein